MLTVGAGGGCLDISFSRLSFLSEAIVTEVIIIDFLCICSCVHVNKVFSSNNGVVG